MSRGAEMYHKMDISDGRRSKSVRPRDSAGNGVVINVGDMSERHPWEKFYGVDSVDGSVGKSDYRNIFTSPYFDYRRTHSKASTTMTICMRTGIIDWVLTLDNILNA